MATYKDQSDKNKTKVKLNAKQVKAIHEIESQTPMRVSMEKSVNKDRVNSLSVKDLKKVLAILEKAGY